MTEFKSDSSVGRILKNASFAALRFGIFALSGVFFIPFLVRSYGSGAYGLIALAGFLTQYVGMVSGCIGRSVARFLNIALNRNDWQQANEIFSTAIVANLGSIALQIPLFALGVWKLNLLIDFPPEMATDFRILVVCNILIFFLNILMGVFFTPIQAANRLDIGEMFDITTLILRLVLLFTLITTVGPKLWLIGGVDLGLTIGVYIVGLSVYHKLVQRGLKFRIKDITRKWIFPILNMAGWTLVSALGFALFVKTDVWIINRFVCKESAGIYAALLVWPNFIKQVGSQLASLVGPVYMIDFAKDNHARIVKICLFLNKMLGLFAAVAVGFVFLFARDMLSIWLGAEFAQYALLLKLMTLALVLTLGEAVVWGIFPAINKTHYSGLANLVTGVLNIGLSIGLVMAGYGVYGVAAGTLVSTILKCAWLLPYAVAKELKFSYMRFVANYVFALLLFGGLVVLNSFVRLYIPDGLLLNIFVFALSVVLLAIPVYLLVLSASERAYAADAGRTFCARFRSKDAGKNG